VIRTLGSLRKVLGQGQPPRLGLLLQRRLGVGQHERPLVQAANLVAQLRLDEGASGLEAAIQGDGAHQGLEDVLQQGGSLATAALLLGASHLHPAVQTQPRRLLGQTGGADEVRAHAGEHALVGSGKALEQQQRRGMPEHRIAEELEPLIAATGPRLIGRAVAQRPLQQTTVGEGVPEIALQRSVPVVSAHAPHDSREVNSSRRIRMRSEWVPFQ
jgi:hypothetical protein